MKKNTILNRFFLFALIIAQFVALIGKDAFGQNKMNVLVFSKTAAFRHQSIEAGKSALEKMAKEKNFNVNFTENADQFEEANLKKYNVIAFLNTTGDILDNKQQESFERYIQAGGGYVGVHAATDTEYEWNWYNQLAGAWFLDHPSTPSNVQNGRFFVTKNNEFTAGMPESFERSDEFYSFKNISSKINVVLKIDEKSYIGGKNGDNHPISWYQEFDGGRSFYTAMGHTDETYSEPLFLNHLWAGIKYAAGGDTPKPLDFSKSRPEENRFTKVILEEKLDEPIELSVLNDGRILFIQRKGEVRIFNTKSKTLKTIAKIPVSIYYVNKEGKESMAEDGLLGLNKDPNFATNHWVYMYYSSTKGSYNVLSRFTLQGDDLLLKSEKEILRVPTQREECCHTGGSIAWDKMGNLYLSTGDNTNPHGSDGYSPSDESPGRSPWDAQKSSANTNDLRGKIIRIKPQADATYTIPEGNLFPFENKNQKYSASNIPKSGNGGLTRPEIYTMGHRNPYRISVDQQTGFVYWGEVGPDASKPDSTRGPEGFDEVGQARSAGNFGWPHFIANNKAYHKYDFEKKQSLAKWNVLAPENKSPNNTGLTILPPAQNAFIWYPYDISTEFPLTGTGGRNAMAGPVFYSKDFATAKKAFPKYYDGKLITYDWMRGWIMSVSMDKEGNLQSMEKFMPSYKFSNPIDMEFANDGDLYMLEYGTGWFSPNDDARLIKIEFNGGNRKPKIEFDVDKTGGAIPLTINLSSKGTTDADNDALKYFWKITSTNGYNKIITTQEASLNLQKEGIYKVTLTVNDGKGGISTQSTDITAGNEPPQLSLEMPKNNKTFYVDNNSFDYEIKVKDKEDGTLEKGIKPDQVAVNIDYLAEGYDKNVIAMGHRSADASSTFATGRKLLESGDCLACHNKTKKSIGPTYTDISKKYKSENGALEKLVKKVIAGGGGVWGETPMSGHPQLSNKDATEMVKYILNIANEKTNEKSLPVKGTYTTKPPITDKNKGVYIVRAAYEDQGTKSLPSLKSEKSFVLRNSKVDVHGFDFYQDINKMAFGGNNLAIPTKSGAYMSLKQVDLNNLTEIVLAVAAPKPQLNASGGTIQVRIGGPDGTLIGESKFVEPTETMDFTPKQIDIPFKITTNFLTKPQDIYLKFVNPNAQGSLMVVMGLEFKLANEK